MPARVGPGCTTHCCLPPDLDLLACSKEEQALRATEAAQRRAELERRAAEKKAEEARQLRQAARDEARQMRCVVYWLWPCHVSNL